MAEQLKVSRNVGQSIITAFKFPDQQLIRIDLQRGEIVFPAVEVASSVKIQVMIDYLTPSVRG